jgi:hypothetical protein
MGTHVPRRHLIIAVIALALQLPMMQALDSPPRPEQTVAGLTP